MVLRMSNCQQRQLSRASRKLGPVNLMAIRSRSTSARASGLERARTAPEPAAPAPAYGHRCPGNQVRTSDNGTGEVRPNPDRRYAVTTDRLARIGNDRRPIFSKAEGHQAGELSAALDLPRLEIHATCGRFDNQITQQVYETMIWRRAHAGVDLPAALRRGAHRTDSARASRSAR